MVENTVGKREIALYEQLLFFSTVFSKDLYCRHEKTRACMGKGKLITRQQNLDWSELKQIADHILKCI